MRFYLRHHLTIDQRTVKMPPIAGGDDFFPAVPFRQNLRRFQRLDARIRYPVIGDDSVFEEDRFNRPRAQIDAQNSDDTAPYDRVSINASMRVRNCPASSSE